jgi:hypothetical protein
MRFLQLTWCLALFALSACGGPADPGPNVHDTKYRAVDNGNCVADTITGLMWEAKSATPGLHDWRHTYTWFHPDEPYDDLDYRGMPDGGECEGSACDVWNFVQAVNAQRHCGYDDWRMPSRDELFSISDLTRTDEPPTANLNFFPHTQAAEYWTGFDYGTQHESAWAWNFIYGHDRVDWKRTPKYVRLVRGTASTLEEVKE